jgi:hypothetical protein
MKTLTQIAHQLIADYIERLLLELSERICKLLRRVTGRKERGII